MEHPFFSVLIPVYNAKAYLDMCIQSVVDQNFSDYELILVNDGSSDGSGELCEQWQKRFPEQIRVMHQTNKGVAVTRFTALQMARGKYIISVDADDLMLPDAMCRIYDTIIRYDADVVIYNGFSKRDMTKPMHRYPFPEGEVLNLETSQALRKAMFGSFMLNSLWLKSFRRELAADWDPETVAHIRQGEDLVYSLMILDRAQRVVLNNSCLYYYRPTPGSITNTYRPWLFRVLRDVLRVQRSYALKWDSSGELARACDVNGLNWFFEDVVSRVMRSSCSRREKYAYMLEMVTDEDFIRDYACIQDVPSTKARFCLFLVKNRCFFPLYLYGKMRNVVDR